MKLQSRNSIRNMHTNFSVFGFGIIIVLICILFADVSDAKRGCSAFGHACYGGHGKKRNDINFPMGPLSSSVGDETLYLNSEIDPQQLAVSSSSSSAQLDGLSENNNLIPMRDMDYQQQYAQYYQKPLRTVNLATLMKQWLQSYRRFQEQQPTTQDQPQHLQMENQL